MHEAIELRLGPSRTLAVALGVAHSIALAAIWRALPAMLAAPMSLVVMCSAAATIRRHALRTSGDAVIGLAARAEGVWLRRRDGQVLDGSVHPETVVLPWLVIVRLQEPGRHGERAVVVARDSTTLAGHRRLRVFLRWGQPAAAGRSLPWRWD